MPDVPEVMESLRREHVAMTKLLDAFERQLNEVERGGQPDYDIVVGVVDYCLAYPDLYHHPKEDLVFERLKQRDAELAEAAGDLLAEHETLGALTRQLGDAVRKILLEAEMPRDVVLKLAWDFLGHYRRHIAMEDARFFPAALEVLTPEDWDDIAEEVAERADPLFSQAPEQRFLALRDEILGWDEMAQQSANFLRQG